eukprot:gene17892-12827_t
MDMEELLTNEVCTDDAKAGTDIVEQIAVAASSPPSSTQDIKQQLLLLKKSSFRKQTSQRATAMSDDSRVESPPAVEPEEESVEVPDEEHADAAASVGSSDPAEAFATSPRTVEADGRSVSPRLPVRTVVLGQNNPALSGGQRRTVRAAPQPSSSAVHATAASSYAARLQSRRHSSPPPANAHHSSPSSVDHDVGDDCDDSPSAGHHEAPHDATSHLAHHKPPIPRQDPSKLQAHRLRRLKVEKKEAKKRKALAWAKDPKYHYDERTGLFTTFEIDARIEARRAESLAKRQAQHYDPLAALDEVSTDEDDAAPYRNDAGRWKKKLYRRESPATLDRDEAERRELRRRMEYLSMQSHLNQQRGIKNCYQIFAVPRDFKGFSPPRVHKPGPPPRPPQPQPSAGAAVPPPSLQPPPPPP